MGKPRSATVLILGVALGLGIALGLHSFGTADSAEALHVSEQRSPGASEVIGEVIARIKREYVDGIDEQRLVDSAIRGILGELDQHSSYLDPDAYQDIRITTTGNYTGVGLDVSLENGKVTVIAPIEGAPAAIAGILPGDVVVSVDDVLVDEQNVAASVDRMRGAPGTEVRLGVLRAGASEPLSFALRRAAVKVETVSKEYLGNGLAYIRLAGFADATPYDLARAARELMREADGSLLGIVLDLRNNPGGVLDSAIGVADAFIGDGLIVSGTGRGPHSRFEQYARPGDVLERVPAVVLVNGSSASASEIVAGALQDHRRAQIVGERTYGKGSVQTVMPLGEGAAIKLTTSRYLTPSGRAINGRGIEPDVTVYNSDPLHHYRGGSGAVKLRDDPQLVEALRLISYESITVSHAR